MLDGSFVKDKTGPLPNWAWMGLALGAALAYSVWSKNKQGAKKQQTPEPDATEYPDSVKTPQYTFVDADTTLVTVHNAPPGGGRPPSPPAPPAPPIKRPPHRPRPPAPPKPTPGPPPPGPAPTPTPSPTPPPPPAPAGSWETVIKWAKGQAKGTPSTLWGIAEKWYGNGSGWQRIWSAPQNASLRATRSAPEKIQPGDRIWVPK